MGATLSINVKATPVFFANKQAYDQNVRVIANEGGSRSSKTYSVSQLLITIALNSKKEISVVSATLPHLKKGARKDILEILENWNIFNEEDFNRTDNKYYFPKTGSYIEFFAVDEPGKAKGPGRDILFVNEANEVGYETYRQLAMRTRENIFIDYNPDSDDNWVYKVADAPGTKLIKSTYRNNLANLAPQQVQEIESLNPETNPLTGDRTLWNIFGLGKRGERLATIYTNWYSYSGEVQGTKIYGLDFGYNDPCTLIEVTINDKSRYAREVWYQTKLTTPDIINLLKENNIPKGAYIFADSANPDKIREISLAGYNIHPADKSIKDGIIEVKSAPLYIHEDSLNMRKEIKNYKWKETIDGKILDEPIDLFNHSLDALRYAIYSYHRMNLASSPGPTKTVQNTKRRSF